MTDWAQISTGLLFDAYVGIHQVRIRVFDNYQYVNSAFKFFPLKIMEIFDTQRDPYRIVCLF